MKIYEHTVLVVYPDHTPYGTPFAKENNHLFILFPGMKKVESRNKIKRNITYYDFGPTIMDYSKFLVFLILNGIGLIISKSLRILFSIYLEKNFN